MTDSSQVQPIYIDTSLFAVSGMQLPYFNVFSGDTTFMNTLNRNTVWAGTSWVRMAGNADGELVVHIDDSTPIKVDTELKVNSITGNIDNLFVASTDGTDAGAVYIRNPTEGAVYPATAPSLLLGARAATTPAIIPGVADGDVVAPLCDRRGVLWVSNVGGGGSSGDINHPDGTALATTTNAQETQGLLYYWDSVATNWKPQPEIATEATVSAGLATINSLVPSVYDYIGLSGYVGTNPGTIVFKTGGAGGTLVSTLTLAYSGGNLTSVTKT